MAAIPAPESTELYQNEIAYAESTSIHCYSESTALKSDITESTEPLRTLSFEPDIHLFYIESTYSPVGHGGFITASEHPHSFQ
jgi:hypothetical protein